MIRIAYLIVAHNNPNLLCRMIGRLSDEGSGFFIHIDKKSDLRRFGAIQGENVFFSDERVPVFWGEYSMVDATLILLRGALAASHHYDYFVLLSGSDYPLWSSGYIRSFLEQNGGSEFMSIVKIPNEAAGQSLHKINKVWMPSDKPVIRFAFRALGKIGLAQRDYRRYLGNLEPYSGATWWTLTRSSCQYIIEFLRQNPHIERFFRNAPAPDEMIFHTILGNSKFMTRMRRNLFYTDWSAGGSHPAMISERHLALFEGQGKICFSDPYGFGEVLFARKFSDTNLDLVKRIDNMIALKEGSRSADKPANPLC